MSDTKREHYVPECYLRMFTNSDGYLAVWDKEKKKAFSAKPKDVCNEHLLYETKWEDADKKLGDYVLKNCIEKEFSKSERIYTIVVGNVIDRIQKKKQIVVQASDKRILNQFFSLLYLRHPIIMTDIIKFYEGVEREADGLYESLDYLFDIWNFGKPDSIFEHSKKAGIFDFNINTSPAKAFENTLDSLHMEFWVSKEARFITSSFPVFLYEEKGTREKDIIIPVSPQIVISYTSRLKSGIKKQWKMINSDLVVYINSLYAYDGNKIARFILGENESDIFEARKRNNLK